MSNNTHYMDMRFINKELSWLSFNHRVLQEAEDSSVPLIERARFLGIYANNLDEFYKVRIAEIKRHILIESERNKGDNAQLLLARLQQKIDQQNERFTAAYDHIIHALQKQHIHLNGIEFLAGYQQAWLQQYFSQNILPHLTPQLLSVHSQFHNHGSYLAVIIEQEDNQIYALVDIPTQLDVFIKIPTHHATHHHLIFLDEVIRFYLTKLFQPLFSYRQLHCYAITITRDSQLDWSLDEEQSVLDKLSLSLTQRLSAPTVRLVYQDNMPDALLQHLCQLLNIDDPLSLQPTDNFHNDKWLMQFPSIGNDHLVHPKLPPLISTQLAKNSNPFLAISAHDVLLYYPYHDFLPLTELIRLAAFDPLVHSIKINIYRLASQSRIVRSLIQAAKNGKQVTVIVELQARFDEEANLSWAKQLQQAGVRVLFGVPGLKIHSKLCLITRSEHGKWARYAHIGTGNFNEDSAQVYTDFSLLTADKKLTKEVRDVFRYIANPYYDCQFEHLLVSPRNMRQKLYHLIKQERKAVKQGHIGKIVLKLNNLTDEGLIEKLYQASQDGVEITLIIRGMCSLQTEDDSLSKNIRVISIVDRFLEHSRVMIFHNQGQPDVYISSADWMTRNVDRRIEVGCPIYDPQLKQTIIDIMALHLQDSVKARVIDAKQSNQYRQRVTTGKKVRSQLAIYRYLKRQEKRLGRQHEQ
ncbi:TPA: polyphosphate kinase 1 [Photobacterium damselae]